LANANKIRDWIKKRKAKKSNGGSDEAGMTGVEVLLTAAGVFNSR
jgi:hypothetical protein